MVRHDSDLYELAIGRGRARAVIDTTRNHLFYDLTRRRWTRAGQLRPGDSLRGPAGDASATVLGGYAPRHPDGWMWDISVPGGNDHDFYILTPIASVLVHNCPAPNSGDSISRYDKFRITMNVAARLIGQAHGIMSGEMDLQTASVSPISNYGEWVGSYLGRPIEMDGPNGGKVLLYQAGNRLIIWSRWMSGS
jgi:hypothetical protein